ncbi:PEP_CTERM-anchored TLD domain-containing protein [Massilia soli]|uniref:PEP_CTERM-anchored TLD domain-containing protein n=1 Tax=Massilia soli TaxID=2792854 RepID=A0ABS7SLY7_9BURK|nr:PEP_CTERM-anchored TLD domain-containing protein [Massilia soli]MBZ2206840.1 PEP_CTERM-anchored TLD domain-containing protein [Massilia soli]
MNNIKMAGAALVLACALPATAGAILGGSALLDASGHAQLERWLGQGKFDVSNVFTRGLDDSSVDFHAATDGRGPTFTLMQVTNASGHSFLVGGFNPQSWSSSDGWHDTPGDPYRSAFIFNMTEPALYRQVLSDYVLPSQGERQTFNGIDYGPTFGTGHDLYVNAALTAAFSWQVTYGDPLDSGLSIIDRSLGGQLVKVDALEVFTLSPIPEPATYAMLLAGLALLGGAIRRACPSSVSRWRGWPATAAARGGDRVRAAVSGAANTDPGRIRLQGG